jgi:hypothetical protein
MTHDILHLASVPGVELNRSGVTSGLVSQVCLAA